MSHGASTPSSKGGGVDAAYPFSGRWLVQNSPADRVPSHGTTLFATSYAIDFVPVGENGGSAPLSARSLVWPEPAERFPGFGRPVSAPAAGQVIGVQDGEPDHAAFRGLPSLWYAMTQARRAREGWRALAGNHLLIAVAPRVVIALCHLRRGSIRVTRGETVGVGDLVGECGNSGNSTEPHLHVQAMDGMDAASASPVLLTFSGGLARSGTIVEPRPR